MEKSPALSIVIPAHNAMSYLPELVAGVKNQTFDDFEVFFVDDGSTDETLEYCQSVAHDDTRFAVLHQSQSGPGIARNLGLEHASGEYVFFFDSDDLIDTPLLEHARNCAVASEADIVIYQSRQFDCATGSTHPSPDAWDARTFPAVFNPLDYGDNLFDVFKNWPWDKMFRRQFLLDAHIAFPALYRTEDLLFTCAALASASKIALLDEVLYTYRVNSPSSSTQTNDCAPLDFYESAKLLKAFLEKQHLAQRFQATYNRWVGLCVAVNLMGLRTAEAFEQTYRTMHCEGLQALGLDKLGESDFDDNNVYQIIRIVAEHDVAGGTFLLWHLDRTRMQTAEEAEIARITSSKTFRLGSTLLKPFTNVKDKRESSR